MTFYPNHLKVTILLDSNTCVHPECDRANSGGGIQKFYLQYPLPPHEDTEHCSCIERREDSTTTIWRRPSAENPK